MVNQNKGVKLSCFAVEHISDTAYSVCRFKCPSEIGSELKTAKEAFDLFWKFTRIERMAHSSFLERRLQSGVSHVDKVLREANDRKCNVLILPKTWSKSSDFPTKIQEFFQELNDRFVEECGGKWERRLLGQVRGGVKRIALPANRAQWPVHTGHIGIDRAYARTGSWLDTQLPIQGLQVWGRDRRRSGA